MGNDHVRRIPVRQYADSGGQLDRADGLLADLERQRALLTTGDLLKLDFRGVTEAPVGTIHRLADFARDFPRLAGEERYILFANLQDSLHRALNDALLSLGVCGAYSNAGATGPLGLVPSNVGQVMEDLTLHSPWSTVDVVAARLKISPAHASKILSDAYASRVVGRTRPRILPDVLRKLVPPTLSRFRGFLYFPLWAP